MVTRIKDGMTLLPSAMAFGAAGDPALTEGAWRVAGSELAALGHQRRLRAGRRRARRPEHGDRLPVLRRRPEERRPVRWAARCAGLQGAGVAATLKHFPGHGNTAADSHQNLPVLKQDKAALDRVDLPPFAAGIDAGAWLVMSGHLDARAVDPGVPATFSHKVLDDVLRRQLGFTGVVVTDGMNMAPAERWPAGRGGGQGAQCRQRPAAHAAERGRAYDGLLAGLRDGSLPRARLVEAATRVLTLKFRLAGRGRRRRCPRCGAGPNQQAVQRASAAAAVTQLRGPCDRRCPGPVRVTASGGREHTRDLLAGALTRRRGPGGRLSGGRIVHLVGYGDGPGDLRADAAVTVAMDTPYVLAKAKSGDAARDVLVDPRLDDRAGRGAGRQGQADRSRAGAGVRPAGHLLRNLTAGRRPTPPHQSARKGPPLEKMR